MNDINIALKEMKIAISKDKEINMLYEYKRKFIESKSRFYISKALNDNSLLYEPSNSIISKIDELIEYKINQIKEYYEKQF